VLRVRRGEEGSTLLIALMVMMILSTLSLGVLARSLSVMSFVRHGQDFDAALAEADAGLAHALRELDASAANPPSVLTREKPTTDLGAGRWKYRATRINDLEYEVRVLGTVGESRQGVRAKVTRGAKYPYALFADQSLDLSSGGLDLGLSSWLTLGSPDTDDVHIGTNGDLLVEPGADAGDFQHIFPPNGQCTGCDPDTLVVHDEEEGAYELPPVVKPPAGTPTQACPMFGTFSGLVNGMNGRPFVCERNVVMSGVVSVVNPPFVVYVLPNPSTGADSSLDLRTAIINAGQRADHVEIKKAGSAPLLLDLAFTPAQLTFSGVLYAPDSTLHLQGSKWWSGSVTVDRVMVSKNALGVKPVLNLGYDLNLASASKAADWQVSRYAQTAAVETGLM
jgi:hypothetical protein